MLLTIGRGESMAEIWEFCDPFVTEPGITMKECQVPALQSIFIGYGSLGNTVDELDAAWGSINWELYLDGQTVNLPAFGTIDQVDDSNASVLRLWNVVLEQPAPGVHTLRYLSSEGGELYDITWIFTVTSPATMEIPAGTESLPFTGTSSAFSTLGEFDSLMKSAIASGEIDSFWDAVTSTGQMPLIFGDSVAVFLYRGQAENVECRGDFTTQYMRQGETDLWAFLKQFEPDTRLEYKILLNSSESILDPLNALTETGGLGTNSVVLMPKYVIPEFTLPRDNIAHGTLNENITISSQFLGYDVNYRVYTPAGYETLASLPVIYVTDGQDFSNPGMGAMVNALDNLIADGRIEPVIAVFIDSRDPLTGDNRRADELVADSLATCPFCDFIALELVPTIDAAYKTNPSPDARAILGFSLGGNFTAHMGLAYADVFHQIAILSPYISANWIFDTYQAVERLPLKIFLGHGTYDERAASIHLREILQAKSYSLLYIETHEGHSYGNVRGLLDDMLIYFFGAK
ncbi:MAG: esterase [Anaerolineaceae bacterium]|nr:MAG: esterase [Anaerolineaceae bacterium]